MTRRIFPALAAICVLLIMAASAQARSFQVLCQANQNLQVDPIVSPGVYPSAHLHTFFGATGVTQDSTLASLEAGGTSCTSGLFVTDSGAKVAMTPAEVAADTAGQWTPTMLVDGVAANPDRLDDYWKRPSGNGGAFTNMPEGLQLIGGDSHATAPPPEYVLYWNCGSSNTGTYPSSTKPTICPSRHTLVAHIEMPLCWDGAGLSPSDVVNPGAPVPFSNTPSFYPCPLAYPTRLPSLQLLVFTGLSGDVSKSLSFSSGPYYTLHGDYWQSWHDQPRLASLEQFLRTGAVPS